MTTPRSISDDDLCSSCKHCDYQPGELSTCSKRWPASLDADGYAVSCDTWKATAGGNSADTQQTGDSKMNKQATIKVIVVNPIAGTVVCVQMLNDFEGMKANVIGCEVAEVIDCGAPDGESVNVLAWIDEEGTLKDWDSVGWTELAGGAMTLAGNIVFTGPTDESEEGGGAMTDLPDYFDVTWAEAMCRFIQAKDVKLPGVSITTVGEDGDVKTDHIGPKERTYETH